jgi:hypothetical protein
MPVPPRTAARPAPPPGLCGGCAHQRLVPNTRGSVFSLCERSREDPAYPRYPSLPVLSCAGYEPRPERSPGGGGDALGL